MINKDELQVSNKSYTNKDFATIYPELLDLAQKLSSKWNPANSNESDPGVVLLKLLAFIGDKVNYNIDKNILECFMPSATQETSMRQLCEMNGYNVRYYQSAETDISFLYLGNVFDNSELPKYASFVLPEFTTTITNDDSSITYTLTRPLRVEKEQRGVTQTVPAIQGVIKDMYVNGDTSDTIIQLVNLDDNNRLLLPYTNIAQNGIFISNDGASWSQWERVDNLNIVEPGRTVYKFGYDSSQGLPYIEFPNDIASLIKSGLRVKYTLTEGEMGNVKVKTLNTLQSTGDVALSGVSSDIKVEDLETALIINNLSASINGQNPQSIDEAYNSYKKTIGTFNTLVTCRDYANAIYNLVDENSLPLVSNVQVSDRRTDINYSQTVLTFAENGVTKKSLATNFDEITPFDICIYPLKPIKNTYNESTYRDSFKPLLDSNYILQEINPEDENYNFSDISHTYKLLDDGLKATDIFCYKNYYSLNAKITTNIKVNTYEQKEIVNNIWTALFENLNARNVDYGYEIPFDTLLNIIENADTRIRNVSLAEPELTTKVMLTGSTLNNNGIEPGTEKSMDDKLNASTNETYYINLLAKNVVSGRLPLFRVQEGFDFGFGQSLVEGVEPFIDNLKSINTEASIVLSNAGTTLRENEIVQFSAPNFVSSEVYGAYIWYNWNGDTISQNAYYQLKGTDIFEVKYTENDVEVIKTYTPNSVTTVKNGGAGITVLKNPVIIKPNFELKPTAPNVEYDSIASDGEIAVEDFIKKVHSEKQLYCYWIRNNADNILFKQGESEIQLGANEYFMWSPSDFTELNIMGSGTVLKLDEAPRTDAEWKLGEKANIDNINTLGLSAFVDLYNWQVKNLSENSLTLQEMQILTLTEGDNVRLVDVDVASSITLTNDLTSLGDTPFAYTIGSEPEVIISPMDIEGAEWKVRSRLDINTTTNNYQSLKSGQTMTLISKDEESSTPVSITVSGSDEDNITVMFDSPIELIGGEDVDVTVTYFEGDSISPDNLALSCYICSRENIELNGDLITRDSDGFIKIQASSLTNSLSLPLINLVKDSVFGTMLFMAYVNDSNETTFTLSGDSANLRLYNSGNSATNSLTLSSGINIVEIVKGSTYANTTLTLSASDTSNSTIMLGEITSVVDINGTFKLNDDEKTALLESIKAISTKDNYDYFYYNAPLQSQLYIEEDDLKRPEALWNFNNIGNRFTIGEIDINNSSITIARTSKL